MTLEGMSEADILGVANPRPKSIFRRSVRSISGRRGTSPGESRWPFSNVPAERRLSGGSGSPKRLVNSLPKCSSWKRTAPSWSITQWCSKPCCPF